LHLRTAQPGWLPTHGSDQACPEMEWEALLAVEAADTIVGVLHRAHRQDRTPTLPPRALYEDNRDFNEAVDDSHEPGRFCEVEFRPSEVQGQMEPESHRVYFAEFATSSGSPPVTGES